jgi:hypothetical protein
MHFPSDLDTFLRTPVAHGATPNKDVFDEVWKIVQECGEEERHFNTLQSVYRGVASSWLLATFGAVGVLLSAHPWMAGGICWLGALGICLLWMLDLHIYHRFLEAAFQQGLDLEEKFHWLPQFRTKSERNTKKHVRRRLALYYLFTALAPAVVGVGLLYENGHYRSALAFCVTWLIVVSTLLALTIKRDR